MFSLMFSQVSYYNLVNFICFEIGCYYATHPELTHPSCLSFPSTEVPGVYYPGCLQIFKRCVEGGWLIDLWISCSALYSKTVEEPKEVPGLTCPSYQAEKPFLLSSDQLCPPSLQAGGKS